MTAINLNQLKIHIDTGPFLCKVCVHRCKKVHKTDFSEQLQQKIYFCSAKCFEIHNKYVSPGSLKLNLMKEPKEEKE